MLSGPISAPMHPVQPRAASSSESIKAAAALDFPPRRSAAASGEETLPGAMRAGHYAFWPKRLPGAASRRPQPKAVAMGANVLTMTGGAASRQPMVNRR